MKKLLFLLTAVMLLPVALSAQLLNNQEVQVQRAQLMPKSLTHQFKAPARADLADNQMILGHYDTDDIEVGGYLGLTNFAGVIPIAVELTPDELAMFQGGKIVAFRVGLSVSTNVSRVFVAPSNDSGLGTFTEWNCNVRAQGWNTIPVDPPYEINLDDETGLFIGFDYRQTATNYPLSYVEVGDTYYNTYAYLTYQGTTGWLNIGTNDYGNLSLQCIVESDHFPEYLIQAYGLSTEKYIKMGDDIEFSFNIKNGGIVSEIAAGAVTYNVLIDGEQVATLSNTEAFGRAYKSLSDVISSAGLAPGKHTLTVEIGTLNGEPIEKTITMNREFTIYEFGFARQMHLVEQFTAIGCTHCPKGTHMLQLLTEMRNDIAWVAIHQNFNGTDPMRTLQCDTINNYQGNSSFPSASFDRTDGWEEEGVVSNSIGYYADYHQMVAEELSAFFDYLGEAPSFATVNINSTIDPATREAVITINGELTPDFDQMLGADSKLTVYITEDGIVNRQLNDGTWVQNYVHNGVMRRALGSALGNNLNRDGNSYENVYTYTIPSTWNIDNLNVVAFISRPLINGRTGDYTDLFVNQANKRKLGEFDEPTLPGDVDGNGIVNIGDVTMLIQYALTGQADGINLDAADFTQDGTVNINDVTTLIQYVLTL